MELLIQPDVISEYERTELIRFAEARHYVASTYATHEGNVAVDTSFRSSTSSIVNYGESATLDRLYDQLQMRFYGQVRAMKGAWDVIKYEQTQQLKPHFDPYLDGRENNRKWSVILCLNNDNVEGGETNFPKIGRKIKLKNKELLIFDSLNVDGSVNQDAVHEGSAVISGRKIIIVSFFQQY